MEEIFASALLMCPSAIGMLPLVYMLRCGNEALHIGLSGHVEGEPIGTVRRSLMLYGHFCGFYTIGFTFTASLAVPYLMVASHTASTLVFSVCGFLGGMWAIGAVAVFAWTMLGLWLGWVAMRKQPSD